jgi:hypothetical protein
MKVKTSELTGAALDYAVAVALGLKIRSQKRDGVHKGAFIAVGDAYNYIWRDTQGWIPRGTYTWSPSTRWEHGGPLVDQFCIYLSPPHVVFATRIENGKRVPADKVYHCWTAKVGPNIAQRPAEFAELPMLRGLYAGDGETPLIAICRAVVACKLGDEVEVPDELLEAA